MEVDADPARGRACRGSYCGIRDRDAAVALGAAAFVRTHLQAAGHPDLPEPAGDRLRVLLVICRPGGGDDVPFRSVASRLVRGGAEQMEGLDLDVLRPATFARLAEVLHAARGGAALSRSALRRTRHLPRSCGSRCRPEGAGDAEGWGAGIGLSPATVRGLGGRVGAARTAWVPAFREPGQPEEPAAGRRACPGAAAGRHRGAGAGAERLPVRLCRGALDPAGPIGDPGSGEPRAPGWGTCTRGSGRTGRWPPRSPTPGCPAWWRCGTTSTS